MLWQENLVPLMELLDGLATGIRAFVANKEGDPLREATVKINSSPTVNHLTKNMAYFQTILQPGNYTLTFSCKGYASKSFNVSVTAKEMTNLEVILEKVSSLERIPEAQSAATNNVNKVLDDLNGKYPKISKLHTIGRLDNGEAVLSLEIGSQNRDLQLSGVPSILFAGGIEDNSPVTSDVLVILATYLLNNYKKNQTITEYVDKFSIHIVPNVNSLTNLIERCSPEKNKTMEFPITKPLSNNAKIIAKWLNELNAILAVNLLTGSVHVEIPFGDKYGKFSSEIYKTDDEDLLKNLATTYTNNHLAMSTGKTNCETQTVNTGILHTGDAFGISQMDSLIDYMYLNTSTLMLNAYVACCNTDRYSDIWLENKDSLLTMIEAASQGISGYVIDENNEPIRNAELTYDNSVHHIRNDKTGAYWILLRPGSHTITASAPGYLQDTKLIVVPHTEKFTILMFKLERNQNIFGMPRIVFILLTGELNLPFLTCF